MELSDKRFQLHCGGKYAKKVEQSKEISSGGDILALKRNHFFVVIGLRRCYEIFNRNRSLFVHLEPGFSHGP